MSCHRVVALFVTVSFAVLLSGCNVGEARVSGSDEPAEIALPVEVAIPRRGAIAAVFESTAALEADYEAVVRSRVDGEVVDILVEEGDVVARGQVLARLDGERKRLAMRQAGANVEKLRREYERNRELSKRGLVSAATLESMHYELEALQASFELRKLEYEHTAIRAPLAGIVSARLVKTGRHVVEGDRVFVITDTTRLVAHLDIAQTELAKFDTGLDTVVRVDASPDSVFAASVERISPTIDRETGTFRATVHVDNIDSRLAPGMFGRFDIAYRNYPDALLIPVRAVLEEDGETVVYVVADGAAERRVVRTGIANGGEVQVLHGIDVNDRIVVSGQTALRPGSRVLASVAATSSVTG